MELNKNDFVNNKNESKIINKQNKRKNIQNVLINHYYNNNNISIIIIKLLLIININSQILSHNKLNIILFKFSNVTLKIKGPGNKKILGFGSNYYPSTIYINGEKQTSIYNSYNFNLTDNKVELIWNNTINSCGSMFKECSNIIEIDLSNFNTSQVTSMLYMFYRCSSLTSINLSNLNSPELTRTDIMFYGCSSLTSLDLSNFNTSKVTKMYYMFYGCSSLTSLNLSNFNTSQVIDMDKMFYNCSSLTSLNLSSFNTSQVGNKNNMLYGCFNLEYINLKNFKESQLLSYTNMFQGVPDNFIICINESNNNKVIFPQIKVKKCYTIDFSNNWQKNLKKE